MDLFAVVIAVLIGVTFAIFLIARFIAGDTQRDIRSSTAEYQQEVLDRIKPVGSVALVGDEIPASTSEETTTVAATAEPAAAPLSGPQVYNVACFACHGNGIGGAPKIGDNAAWVARIAQGQDILKERAIVGYQGEAGYMPPKGGRVDLSDEEVLAAMAYMIEESS